MTPGLPASIRNRIAGLAEQRPSALTFMAGAFSTLAIAPAGFWPILFATVPCLAAAIDAVVCRRDELGHWPVLRRVALTGWLFGFGYFLFSIYWISASLFVDPGKHIWLLPFSATLMPAGLAIFFAFGAAIAALLWRPGLGGALALAIGLASSEWLRGQVLTGFPWNTIGYALTSDLQLMQWSALVGIHGLTLITILLAALPSRLSGRRAWLAPAAALGVMWIAGALRVDAAGEVPGVRLRVLQPNISQDIKWRFENRAQVFSRYLEMSKTDASGRRDELKGITHVVWPESAVPFLLLNAPDALSAIGEMLGGGRVLITGAVRLEAPASQTEARKIYNSILALGEGGQLVGVYDKIHLVPFGEYVPLRAMLDLFGLGGLTPAESGFAFGKPNDRVVRIPGLPPALALVCYEVIFPDEIRGYRTRPGLILNVTNDGWFRSTAGPHQHLHQARVRAVELGLPLVRSANTGISAIVDPYGRIIASIKLGSAGVIDAPLPAALSEPPYARWGDWIFAAVLSLALLAWHFVGQERRELP
ncbi:MAG: apolipoprotein N-acyltransferase [Hyphomicrobiaceae bacterium]|nr:MAG: apolipoprotein N-acyltransferase [Hyphomicrobiaceae bacterium]